MKIFITKRGQRRIASNRKYLEDNFFLEFGIRFEDKVLETIQQLPDNPQLGREAFPELDRPEIRKILCATTNTGSTTASARASSKSFPFAIRS